MRTRIILLLLMVSMLILGCAPKEKMSRLIPMEDFFQNPEKTGFSLSPDGEHLAFMKPWENRLNVHVQKIGEEDVTRITSATERDIAGYFWANNNRIAYVQDRAGDENFRLYAVNIDGSEEKELTPFEKVRVQLIDELKEDDELMLIGMNKRDARVFDAYRINVNTGEMEMIAQNPGNIVGWQTDHDGNLRVAQTTDGVNTSVLYRDSEKDDFQTLITTNFKETLQPLFFTFDNKNFYVASNIDRDKTAIYEYDIKNKETTQLIFEHPEVDVSGLLKSDKRKKITGVVYIIDKRHYHFFDEDREQLQQDLEERLPGYEVVVTDMSKDETKVMVRTYSDRSLGAYYYLNRKTNEFTKLADVSPWINEEELAEMKPITYKSRDGLTIHGYLTLPVGLKAKKLPVVVNPHGGPWARDRWGFNPEVQFLANRGYAVFQMNFRTSTGYGRKFWEAGFKQWGLAIQDDITDGVKWLINEGIADPKRVGIYGGSFGGYATLAGVTFTPDLYSCGVDYVGVSNLFTLINSIPPYWEPLREMFYEMMGHPEKDKELYEKVSPVFHADNIKVPLLVAQGANDPRVNKQESDQIVEALKKRGIEVTYMVKDNEGHGFRNEENRFDFYRAMEEFLGKYLGGRVEKKS
ncbi:MAG: S9 family peptidase, partial [Candidatus Aminicenantes bacterium]|nr:S9 family peptidase [Candidatus Aminicenantes bacterium]